jgi:hypothetical protein
MRYVVDATNMQRFIAATSLKAPGRVILPPGRFEMTGVFPPHSNLLAV